MKIFNVFHVYDDVEENGRHVMKAQLVHSFLTKKAAESFIKKYENMHVYDVVDDDYAGTCGSKLMSGGLAIREADASDDVDEDNLYMPWLYDEINNIGTTQRMIENYKDRIDILVHMDMFIVKF